MLKDSSMDDDSGTTALLQELMMKGSTEEQSSTLYIPSSSASRLIYERDTFANSGQHIHHPKCGKGGDFIMESHEISLPTNMKRNLGSKSALNPKLGRIVASIWSRVRPMKPSQDEWRDRVHGDMHKPCGSPWTSTPRALFLVTEVYHNHGQPSKYM